MSTTTTPVGTTTTPVGTTGSSPSFGSKDWFLKNKLYLITAGVLIGAGIAIAVIFGKKSGDASTGSGGTQMGGLTGDANAPVNGKWSAWGNCYESSEVNPDNGKKKWKRVRKCIQEAKNGGTPCSQLDGGNSEEVCTPVNGNWADAPPDSDAVCLLKKDAQGNPIKDSKGQEMWVKKRECSGAKYGGNDCVGSGEDSCKAVSGQWPELGFDDPSATCELERDKDGKPVLDAQGRQQFFKTITCSPSAFGGSKCASRGEAGAVTTEQNGQQISKLRCSYSDGVWTNWSACDASNKKARTCTLPTGGGLPCIETYPLINLTSNTDGGFNVSASSVDVGDPAYAPYSAFDGKPTTYWHSLDSGTSNAYNPDTGVYQGATLTTSGTRTWRGEWIQIQFPPTTLNTKFKPVRFTLAPRTDVTDIWKYRSPRKFVLLGTDIPRNNEWTVLFDNTGDSNPGVNNWTTEAQNFTITTSVPSGFLYYRLIITRVGNFDTRPQQPTDQNMKSVQIADFRIIGIPFVDQADAKEVREISSCSRDCQYGVWEGCTYDTTNKKWIQNRQKTEAVGDGAVCDVSQHKRDCPNMASWSEWGAFVDVNGNNQLTGTVAQFKVGRTQNDTKLTFKQVRYAIPEGNKGCLDNIAPTDGLCYQQRDIYGSWGSCNYDFTVNKWIKQRTNALTPGTPDKIECTTEEISKLESWTDFGDQPFRVYHPQTGKYLTVGGGRDGRWDPARLSYGTPFASLQPKGDATYQVYRKGARSGYPDFIWTKDARYCWDIKDRDNITNSHRSEQWNQLKGWRPDFYFQYDPKLNKIRAKDYNLCVEGPRAGWANNIYLRACDINSPTQQFKIVGENE
jgi:hypothetical protein